MTSRPAPRRFLLELLDPDEHRPVQVWPLDPAAEVLVGRSLASSVVVTSPLVSRTHARLVYDGGWTAESVSPLGIWSAGRSFARLHLDGGLVWKLGEHGPSLRVVTLLDVGADAEATVRVRAQSPALPRLDQEKRDREVAEIVATDFFRDLELRAQRLRRDKHTAGEE